MKTTLTLALGSALLLPCALSAGTGTIDDMEHIVIFMQENRAFDHYFGTLQGIRGFNDRTTVPLRNGHNAFYQPTNQSDLSEYMLPFRAEANRTNAMCMPAPEMYYPTDIKMFNEGRMDSWNTARDPGYGMSYFTREDLPYYYELYDNWAATDQYFQSTFTCTCPNRMHLFAGSNGLQTDKGTQHEAVMENDEPNPGWEWETMGETLENAGISWKVYQELDNFDDNGFAWFDSFMKAGEGESLHDKGMVRYDSAIAEFDKDVASDNLPQVSWVIAPTVFSEHASNHPCAGENWTSSLIAALKRNPDVYAKTAFILNYDEGGQFYDHAWTPTPPLSEEEGISTVSTEGEVNPPDNKYTDGKAAPIGLGFRVPGLIISPWTRGNIVVSEIFDHVSTIKLIEKKFGVSCPNISPWRRAMVGDMLSAFDFANPDFSFPDLPSTIDYIAEGDVQCHTLPDIVIPADQTEPKQEEGTRVARALPYEFVVSDATISEQQLSFTIDNVGEGGAPFVLFNLLELDDVQPRNYAVEAGKSITDAISLSGGDPERYAYILMGPNGFVREFAGTKKPCTDVAILSGYDKEGESIVFTFDGSASAEESTFGIVDNAYGVTDPIQVTVKPGESVSKEINLAKSGRWYDFSVGSLDSSEGLKDPKGFLSARDSSKTVKSSMGANSCVARRFMGHLENGKDSVSDPAMASKVPGLWDDDAAAAASEHPPVPERHQVLKRKLPGKLGAEKRDTKDGLVYDEL